MASDLDYIKQQHSVLPDYAWYLVGIVQMKTDLAIGIVTNYLKKIYLDFNQNNVPLDLQKTIEEELYKGKLGESKNLLENFIEKQKGSKAEIEGQL